jgi:hypothetical protein
MKYKAVVYENRNGHRLILYKKFIIWIVIDWLGMPLPVTIDRKISFMITEQIDAWKKYYGDKLSIIDNRDDKQKYHLT